MENTDPKLDFGGLGRPRKETKPQAAEVSVRMPTGAPPELSSTSTSFMMRKPSTRTRTRAKADQEIRARTYGDMPARTNSSRKRADFGWLDERDAEREEKLRTYGKTSIDVPRSAVFRNDSDEDVTLPVAVTSTLANAKMSSSVPNSASLPNHRSMNRLSHQSDSPAAVADAQAAEWMRSEFEKKRQQEASEGRGRSNTSVRPPSRAASIKESVKEYVFPGSRSRALSRAQSKDSLRPTADNDDQGLSRSDSKSGWRSWGVARKLSSRSNSRPGTSKGQPDEAQPRKSESNGINLNRELPPLPSLDTWKDFQEPSEERVAPPKSPMSPTAGTHIASLMRPQEQHQERSSSAKNHRRSGSDTLAMQFNDAFPVRKSSRKQETKAIPQPIRTGPGSPTNAEATMTGWSSTSNLDQRLEVASSNHTRQRSGDSGSASNGNKSADASTFSRKMSVDTTARKTLSNEPKTPGREEQKSKLKKIFSGWMHKKDKKEDWMHKMEKDGVKEGVLVQEGSTSASPVVRY